MPTLSSLKPSILDLPLSEAQQLIKDVRHTRRTYEPNKKKKILDGCPRGKVSKPKVNAIEQMGASELETLIALLEGMKK